MSRARELADFLVASGNQLELKGDAGEDGCIKKNSASGRDELQIYVSGDAYDRVREALGFICMETAIVNTVEIWLS